MKGQARPLRLIIPILILLAASGIGFAWHRVYGPPKRFGVVASGRLFRSGEISAAQLERVARDHSIKTVLSLLDPEHPESLAEREAAGKLGLRWLNVPLSGDGSSRPEDRDRIREIVLDESLAPLLVHCAAGANRTGLACGMYRIHRDGWTYEQVLDEMRSFGFADLDKHENLRAALREEVARKAAVFDAAAREK